jgi:alpha-beta hydrolase superfamily lysophospholipase
MLQRDFYWKSFDGVNVFSTEWKTNGKPRAAIALIHGLGEHIGRYQHVAEFMCNHGFTLTGFDLRGHGKTEGVRGHAPSYQAIMSDIHQNIKNIQDNFPGLPVFLYGHSLGGNLAAYFSITQKADIKAAIITSPGLGTATPVSRVTLTLGKIMYSLLPAMQLNNGLDVTGLSRDPSVVQKYINDPLVHPKVSARLGLDLINSGRFIIDHAGEIKWPILLMQGTEDRLVNPELTAQFARSIPKDLVTYKEWAGFYHELHNEPEKADVLKVMVDFLDSQI